MPVSRDLIYRVTLQTNDAKRQAANIRATFEKELRQIKLGELDTSSLSTATDKARQLRQELENIKPPTVGSGGAGGFLGGQIDDAIGQLKSLVTGYIGLQGVIAAFNTAIDLSRLNTQNQRANKSFEILSKGADEAKVNLLAIQQASGGAVTSLDAIGVGAQAASLGLAKTADGYAELAKASRIIATVSPVIRDQGEALTQLALFSSNAASYSRADQLGLSATEVRDRIEELRKTYTDLDDSQLKLMASTQILEEKFGSLLDTVEARASGLERLTANYNEFKIAVSSGAGPVDAAAGTLASGFSQLTTYIAGTETPLNTLINNLKETQRQAEALDRLNPMARSALSGVMSGIDYLPGGGLLPDSLFGLDIGSINADSDKLKQLLSALDLAAGAVAAGVPGAKEYLNAITAIAVEADKQNAVTSEQAFQISRLTAAYQENAEAGGLMVAMQRQQAEAARLAEQSRQGRVFDQQAVIESALASRAQKVSQLPGIGIEQAIETYRKQREAARAAIDDLVKTGVSNDGEIAIRVAAITQTLMEPFDALEARAAQGFTIDVSAFDSVGAALSNISAGFVDFLPGVADARAELVSLSEQLATTGTLSDEQAARMAYLGEVAYSVADGSSQLSGVINELGGQFLESNAYAAELVSQLVLSEAAFRNGQISAGTYAGITANLTGTLLTLASGAGIATNAIYALNAAQSDMSNLPGYGGGFAVGGSIANRIQSQQQSAGREQNRREMERYNRDMARAQERSATRAGKLLEDGAKKASDQLKNALDKVPGLFSPTSVTEQDMKAAKGGFYTDKADEYLRRLRDEVENGTDWANVSIEEAAQAIESIGVNVAATNEGVLAQFEELWANQALFSNEDNISKFINEEAVKAAQDLQKKSEEGRNNIYAHFGVVIDDAVSAATGGGGGAAPVAPPKLIDIDPLTEGLQTGLDDYVSQNGQAIQQQLSQAQALFFDPAQLFGNGVMGPAMKPGATAGGKPQAAAGVNPFAQYMDAGPQAITLTPTIDATGLQEQLDAIHATVGVQMYVTAEEIKLFKDTISGIVTPKISVETGLSLPVSTMSDWTVRAESNIPSPNVGVQLHTTIEEIDLFKATIAGIVKPEVQVALTLGQAEAGASAQLATAIMTDIGTNAGLFATPGTVVAQLIMAAIAANMKGQQSAGGAGSAPQAGGPAASALVTNLATQFATASAQFQAIGQVPASLVTAGFTAYKPQNIMDGWTMAVQDSVTANGDRLSLSGMMAGGFFAGGFIRSFYNEALKGQLREVGGMISEYIKDGMLERVNGGELAQALSDKVITDLATELEK